MLVARIKRILDEQMGMSCELVADLSHNGIWQEQVCDREVYLHRHGACAFWPADRFSPDHAYASTGQPAFVGSSMSTPSALFVPGPQAHLTHYSISHGTGRCKGASLTETSDAERSGPGGVGGQLGHNYRPIEALADVMEQAGVARMVGKLVPVASYKAT
jgi:RNA-splicing ligase RtcB